MQSTATAQESEGSKSLVKSFSPTRKWLAATITAIAAVLTLWIQQHGFTDEVAIALIGAVAQAAVTYLIPNADTPGGVPLRAVTR